MEKKIYYYIIAILTFALLASLLTSTLEAQQDSQVFSGRLIAQYTEPDGSMRVIIEPDSPTELTPEPVNTNTPQPTSTNTPIPLPTSTSTATNTNTPIPAITETSTPLPRPLNTNTPTPELTAVPFEPILINFQPATAAIPSGYFADSGAIFGDRASGYTYGWEQDNQRTRERNANSDQRLDTLSHFNNNGVLIWSIVVPNGVYTLDIFMGDPSFTNQINNLSINGVTYEDADGTDKYDQLTAVVTVTDGRIDITEASGGSNAKIQYLHITPANEPAPTPTQEITAVPPTPTSVPNPDTDPVPQTEWGNVIACSADPTKWCWENEQAFVPQLAMIGSPHVYYDFATDTVNTELIDYEINRFINQHGFTGFHMMVLCRWWDITDSSCRSDMSQPDSRTFAVLEELITRTNQAGGMVHLWMYGDNYRDQNPTGDFPFDGATERAVLDEIATTLGPIDGWTMGYGFDLFEWATNDQIETWANYLTTEMGDNPHLLGARGYKNQYYDWSSELGYYAVEWHHPDCQDYQDHITNGNGRPAFSEDRFRLREIGRSRDYTMEETRRGLWDSTLCGGVANIWGNLLTDNSANDGTGSSLAYPYPEQIKTHSVFWKDRYSSDMTLCGTHCLTNGTITVYYGEDTDSLPFTGSAKAVDTKLVYQELVVSDGILPYNSDWVVVVGE